MISDNERFMGEALKEAEKAYDEGEVPVGAVICCDGTIIARAHNQVEKLKDPTAHAEMIAITQAASHLDNWRLEGAVLYVTLEPCIMCAGALSLSRIDSIIYGAKDGISGGCGSAVDIAAIQWGGHKPGILGGVLGEKCGGMLKSFFKERRNIPDARAGL